MGACDTIIVDLTPQNVTVEMSTDPRYNVSIVHADVTLEAVTLAGQGPQGNAATITVGTTTTLAPGVPATVTNSGDENDAVFDFGIPTGLSGPPGSQGPQGAAATLNAGTTTTLPAGNNATVNNSGTTTAAVFDFGIPAGPTGATGSTGAQGSPGPQGAAGNAATIAVGTTTTGAAGSNAAVTNSGTSSAAVFNFTIPAGVQGVPGPVGPQGPSGSGTGDMLKSVYDTNNDGISDHAALADAAPWTGITGKPATFPPSAHETTHLDNGSDAIPLATTARTGLSPQIPATNATKQFHRGDNTYAQANYPDLTNLPASFAPSAHASTHVTGGSDIIPIATSSAVGLVPVLPADTTKYLRGDGTFARTAVSTDAGNLATLGSDNLISVPQSSLWSMRLRSFNAAGNPTFEVDQRSVGSTLATVATGTLVQDRWQINKAGTMVVSAGQNSIAAGINLPGTSFAITRSFFRVTITTAEASLAAGDYLQILQNIEGPSWRELQNDVHSLQVLVRSSVAGLTFGAAFRDPGVAHSFTQLFTIPSANTWTLLTAPNLPVWSAAGNFVNTPGNVAYLKSITLACGSTYLSPANGSWQNGNFFGATGQSNLAATLNATFDIAFLQHEPGPVCTTPIDCPFTQNLRDCQRFYQKSYSYGVLPGTVTNPGISAQYITALAAGTHAYIYSPFKCTMAKAPSTVTAYSPATGAINNVRNSTTSGDLTTTGTVNVSDSSFGGFNLTTPPTVAWLAQFHYTADTGW